MSRKILKISSNCVAEELDGDLIVLNIETGQYHKLNATGLFIYEKVLNSNTTIKQLISGAKKKYEGQSVEKDVIQFVDMLASKGIFVFE